MIRISCTSGELSQKIATECPDWKEWKQLKPLFLDIQSYKCAYCECEIGGRVNTEGDRDLYPQDVEHFRPKAEVKDWKPPSHWNPLPVLQTGPRTGYPWLSLEPLNHAAACKTCNQGRKKCFFPILSALTSYDGDPGLQDLLAEKPYLIFPFGDFEATAPEDYIAFMGAEPIPHPQLKTGSHEYWRARITIEILGLRREDLTHPRKRLVAKIAREWCVARLASPTNWEPIMDSFSESCEQFSSCAKYFLRLCETAPKLAQALAIKAAEDIGLPPEEVQVLRQKWPN